MSVLEVSDLNIFFRGRKGEIPLVRGVSFRLEHGRCLGILGESGSGKSMVCKASTRLLDRNFRVEGQVLFQGKNLLQAPEEEVRKLRGAKLCMVLQNPMNCFDPLYRIGEQMAETFAEHRDLSAREIRLRCLDLLHLMQIREPVEVLRKYPHQLSGGMLQRVMIGLALALEPALIIADEPTTAIDSISQYSIMQEFLRIKRELKVAMIFVSHDLGVLSHIADEVLVMHQGRAVEQGPAQQVFREARDEYTRMLIDRHRALMRRFVRSMPDGQKELSA